MRKLVSRRLPMPQISPTGILDKIRYVAGSNWQTPLPLLLAILLAAFARGLTVGNAN